MDLESAIRFLKNNQPLANDLELEENIIEQYDEVRNFFLLNLNPECIPLFLNSFGEGSGFGVYQLVEDVLLNFSNEEVVPHLKNSLCSQHKGVRYWSTQIASSFPNSELINPLLNLLNEQDNDIKYFTILALGEINDKEVYQILKELKKNESDIDLLELIEDIINSSNDL